VEGAAAVTAVLTMTTATDKEISRREWNRKYYMKKKVLLATNESCRELARQINCLYVATELLQ